MPITQNLQSYNPMSVHSGSHVQHTCQVELGQPGPRPGLIRTWNPSETWRVRSTSQMEMLTLIWGLHL